jgi:hypothetical protein
MPQVYQALAPHLWVVRAVTGHVTALRSTGSAALVLVEAEAWRLHGSMSSPFQTGTLRRRWIVI